MRYGQDYEDALEMVRYSEHHRDWDDSMIQEYIEKPLGIRQYKIMRNEFYEPLMFATWGFPNDEQVYDYVGTTYFPTDGYKGGGNDVWLVDFIAKKGYTRKGFLELKRMFMRSGYKKAFWFRPETRKLGWHMLKGK
jgi:hemolysin-activating ACP:hemolysin acyltransferase